jgi:hypothetical protein
MNRHPTRRASHRQSPVRYSMCCPASDKTPTLYQVPSIDTIFVG